MSKLVQAARQYRSAKFRHRGRSPKYLDCAGLLLRSFADCGVVLHDVQLYGREPEHDDLVGNAMRALGAPVMFAPVGKDEPRIGDVIVIKYDLYPHHLMLVGDHPIDGEKSVIHMDGHQGKWVEHILSDGIAAQITHVFRRPV